MKKIASLYKNIAEKANLVIWSGVILSTVTLKITFHGTKRLLATAGLKPYQRDILLEFAELQSAVYALPDFESLAQLEKMNRAEAEKYLSNFVQKQELACDILRQTTEACRAANIAWWRMKIIT